VIASARRNGHPAAMLRQLYEPGRRDRHGVPHLVAGSQEPASLEPERASSGRRNTARLAGWLSGAPAVPGQRGGEQPAWHCTVRGRPRDRALSDWQWALVAADIMHRTGLAPAGDIRAVRWVAARHGRDHIHIVAALRRQDGDPPRLSDSIQVLQAACHDAEDRYGLRSTRPASIPAPAGPPGPSVLARLSFPAGGLAAAIRDAAAGPVPAGRPVSVPARPKVPRAIR
jgi:hypothetical protein